MVKTAEEPKRLEPKKEVLRELFLKSGNLCAFPNCERVMMNAKGIFVGQICHIEGVRGERFRVTMSNEQRRAFSNLMLLCYDHHVETDNETIWTVPKLVKMKSVHEARFTDPSALMLKAFVDQTKAHKATGVKTLKRMNKVLKWSNDKSELKQAAAELNTFIEEFSKVPIESRRLLGALVDRTWRMRNTGAVQKILGGGTALKIDDFVAAYDTTGTKFQKGLALLENYNLAFHQEFSGPFGDEDGVTLGDMDSGWPFWSDLADFCERVAEPLSTFTDDLDFSPLDG